MSTYQRRKTKYEDLSDWVLAGHSTCIRAVIIGAVYDFTLIRAYACAKNCTWTKLFDLLSIIILL